MRFSTTAFLFTLSVAATAQTTYELTNSGTTFDPPLINMVAGDSIHLVLPAPHTCTQVDQATWDANEHTSNGGFNYPSGEHTFAIDLPGTYYYVCIPHSAMGMKGQFVVAINTGVRMSASASLPELFPDPADKQVTVRGNLTGQLIRVFDMSGHLVLQADVASNGVLDVSSLEVGTYMVAITDEEGKRIRHHRLVIARRSPQNEVAPEALLGVRACLDQDRTSGRAALSDLCIPCLDPRTGYFIT